MLHYSRVEPSSKTEIKQEQIGKSTLLFSDKMFFCHSTEILNLRLNLFTHFDKFSWNYLIYFLKYNFNNGIPIESKYQLCVKKYE